MPLHSKVPLTSPSLIHTGTMQKRPTHNAVSQFISSFVPPKPNDVQFLYHVPRHPKYRPDHARVDQVILSVTPTSGVYDTIGYDAHLSELAATPGEILPHPPRTICFLHRPFALERWRVRRGTLVLASHTSFDENLTVGWNVELAGRLGMNPNESVCVQGYKGDAQRRIGIVGEVCAPRGLLERRIKQEFGTLESKYEGGSDEIRVVAIMNAFHAEEVHRVLNVAEQCGWTQQGTSGGRHVLYLTGEPRESGLSVAREYGLSVICVGHRAAEEWGIRYMGISIRAAFPSLQVKEILETEEPVNKPVRRYG